MRRAQLLLDGRVVPLSAVVCESALQRARGLLWREPLSIDAIMWIEPCSAVHTFGMRYPVEVVFCDAHGRVLADARTVAPRRLAWQCGARAALEARPGVLGSLDLRLGSRVGIR